MSEWRLNRTQQVHRVRDQEAKDAKRQGRNFAGRWAASKSTYLVVNNSTGGSTGGRKGRTSGGIKQLIFVIMNKTCCQWEDVLFMGMYMLLMGDTTS